MTIFNSFSSRLSPYQMRLALLAPAVISLVFIACGGKVMNGTSSGELGVLVEAREECVLTSDGTTSTSSSSGLGDCRSHEHYTCTSGKVDINCDWPTSECECGDLTISVPPTPAYGPCPIPASIRSQCGALNIVKGSSRGGGTGGGSTTSTSGSTGTSGVNP